MPNWTIRRAEKKDAAALAECFDAAYSIYAPSIADLPAVSDGIEDDIERNVVWVVARDNQVIGGLVLLPKEDHVVLANVAIDPSATGAGLGRAFMDLAEAETRKLGHEKLCLSTHVDMPENVRLYEHLGWHEIGRSGNKVHMEKSLKQPSGIGSCKNCR